MTTKYSFAVIQSFVITYPVITLVVVIVLGLFLWKRPKGFVQFILIILVVITAFYIFMSFNGSSLETDAQKKDYIHAPKLEKSND